MHASVLTVRASAQMLRGRYRQDGCDQGRRLLGGNDATAPVDEAGPQVVVATTRVWSDRRRGGSTDNGAEWILYHRSGLSVQAEWPGEDEAERG
jgi:hypothetical protein